MDLYWAAPPVTRTLTAATFATSILVYGGILPGKYVVFHTPWIFKFPPELWRLVTPFLISGANLDILLDPFYIYNYLGSLETESARFAQPGDLVVYLFFVCAVILICNMLIFGGAVLTKVLALAFAFTYAQDNPGRKVTYFVITIPVHFLPYAMLALTLATNGVSLAMMQLTGLFAAHLFDFLTRLWPTFGGGRNLLQTPQFVRHWFIPSGTRAGPTARNYGTAFTSNTAVAPAAAGPSTGITSGFRGFPRAWGGRSSGRRLGGD